MQRNFSTLSENSLFDFELLQLCFLYKSQYEVIVHVSILNECTIYNFITLKIRWGQNRPVNLHLQ